MTSVTGPDSAVSALGRTGDVSGAARGSVRAPAGAGFSDMLRAASGKYADAGTDGLDGIFSRAADAYGVPENLLKAVAKAESGYRAAAVSPCGAEGIMQLMPSTAASLGVSDPFDPEQNIMGGAKYLGGLLSSYGGDAKLALAAYNAGSGAVKKYGGVPPFAETQNYVKRVLAYAGDGSSLTVPVSSLSSGGASSVSASAGPVRTDSALGDGLFFSMDDYRLLLEMFAERMEQEALDQAASAGGADSAPPVQESAGPYRV